MSSSTLKTCPECAEEVRVEARKCRFCGYRFDLRQPGERSSRLAGLFDPLRRPPTFDNPYDLLASWGVELESGEAACHWMSARITDAHGYLVLTDRRLLFLESVGRNRYERRHAVPLSAVTGVDAGRRGRSLTLTLNGVTVTFRGLIGEAAAQARTFLSSAGASAAGDPR